MQITHEEARRWIHMSLDEILEAPQKAILESHLASCAECKNYANSIQNMEAILLPLLQKQWTQRPIPLSVGMLISSRNHNFPNSLLLATRIAAVGVMFVVFMISAWQFVLPKANVNASIPASIQPIPIPSSATELVSTSTQTKTCEELSYIVQRNDTLTSIAAMFSISAEEIRLRNNMKSEVVSSGSKLIIPTCNFTPTGTMNTSTTTFTPILRTITSTPGG